MNSFEGPRNLSSTVDTEVGNIFKEKDYEIIRIDNPDKYAEVSSALGMDDRAKDTSEEKHASVYEGLDFDENKIRTQSYYLKDKEKIAAVLAFAITPKKWAAGERYFRKTDGGVVVCDLESICGENPDFVIAPAWTKVDPAYLGKFAIPGFRLFKNVLGAIEEKAPDRTWTEVQAQGTYKQKRDLLKFADEKGVGSFIPLGDLPFGLEDIGVPARGATSTAKMAELMGIPRLADIGGITLGPIYAKKVR